MLKQKRKEYIYFDSIVAVFHSVYIYFFIFLSLSYDEEKSFEGNKQLSLENCILTCIVEADGVDEGVGEGEGGEISDARRCHDVHAAQMGKLEQDCGSGTKGRTV